MPSSRGGSRAKIRLVAALALAALALASLALAGPWWTVTVSGQLMNLPFTGTRAYAPFGSTVVSVGPYPFLTTTNTSDYRFDPNVGGLFVVAIGLDAFGLLWGAGMTAVSLLPNPTVRQRKWGALLGALAFGYLVAATLYVTGLLPAAVNLPGGSPSYPFSGFWGSTSATGLHSTVTFTYGAGWGWYAVLAAAILFLIAAILLYRGRTPSTP